MLIVIDGLDGSGKETQARKLVEKFGNNAEYVTFPNYDSKSSELVKMYLNGEIKAKASDVNPCAASLFYTADRYISYETQWGKAYKEGKIIVADRYTTSNIIHQMAKMHQSEWMGYINWMFDLEFTKVKLPIPDLVFFLHVPIDVSQRLLAKRYENDNSKKDIHERDVEYLYRCYDAAMFAAKQLKWVTIECYNGTNMRSIDEIHADIVSVLNAYRRQTLK